MFVILISTQFISFSSSPSSHISELEVDDEIYRETHSEQMS